MSIKRFGTGAVGAGGQPLPFARAVEADGWLHVSGQVAMENGEIINGGIVEQTHKTLQNLVAILQTAGLGPQHVLKATVYVANMDDFALVNQLYAEVFTPPFPAREVVQAARLPKNGLVEISAIAAG